MNETTPESAVIPEPITSVPQTDPDQAIWKGKRSIIIAGIVLVVLIIIILISRGISKSTQVAAITEQINTANKKGDYKRVEELAKQGLTLSPNNPDLQASLITAIASEGNQIGNGKQAIASAQSVIDSAIKANPADKNVQIAVGYANEISGDYQKALSYYQNVLKQNPSDATALFHEGHIYEFLDRPDAALSDYEKAYEIDPKNPQVVMALARTSVLSGSTDQATKYYTDVTNLTTVTTPLKAEALTNEAILKEQQLLYPQEALALAKQAADTDPMFSPAIAEYGYNLGIMGQYVLSLQTLDKAIALDPHRSANYLLKGMTDMTATRYQAARDDYTQGLSVVDNDTTVVGNAAKKTMKAELTYYIGKNYIISNNLVQTIPQVIQIFKQAVQYDPRYAAYIKSDDASKLYVSVDNDPQFQTFIRSL